MHSFCTHSVWKQCLLSQSFVKQAFSLELFCFLEIAIKRAVLKQATVSMTWKVRVPWWLWKCTGPLTSCDNYPSSELAILWASASTCHVDQGEVFKYSRWFFALRNGEGVIPLTQKGEWWTNCAKQEWCVRDACHTNMRTTRERVKIVICIWFRETVVCGTNLNSHTTHRSGFPHRVFTHLLLSFHTHSM